MGPFVPPDGDLRTTALVALSLAAGVLFLLAVGFAAYTVVLRRRNDARAIRRERLEARWEELVLAAMDRPEKVEELRAGVEASEGLAFTDYLLSVARRIRGRELEVVEDLAAPFLPTVVEEADDAEVGRRARAIQVLGTLGLPEYEAEVRAALDDPSPLVAIVAARRLCRPDEPDSLPAVLATLHRFRTWNHHFLSNMLADVGSGAAPALRRTLADRGVDPWVRRVSAEALAVLADLEAADPAADVVRDDSDPELTAAALELLGEVGRGEHVGLVRGRIDHDDSRIRSRALTALGKLGGEEDRALLIRGLADESPWVAKHAAHGLLEAGSSQLLEDFADSEHSRSELANQVLHEADRR